MVNTPAKIFLTLAAFAGVTAVAYGVASGDRSGGVLFTAVLVAAVIAALAIMGAAGADPLDPDEDDAAEGAVVSYGPADAARPSPWPLLGALAAGLVAVGAAEGPAYVVAGGILVFLVAAGWTAQAWTEDPRWTPARNERLGQRVMVPGLLPVVAFAVAAFIAISFSRVLLAVSKDGSVAVALAIAVLILTMASVVAYRPRLGAGALVGVVAVGAVLALSAGVLGAAAGEREFRPEQEERPAISIAAENTAFDKKKLVVPANEKSKGEFANKDEIFHNFAVYTTDGKPLFSSRPVEAKEEVFELRPLAPGTYTFLCDFHPDAMKGVLVVK